MSVQHPNPLWFLTCLLHFLATIFEYLIRGTLGNTRVSRPLVAFVAHATFPFSLWCFNCAFPHSLRQWLNGRAAGHPLGYHMAAISRKPVLRNREQEVHTSDDRLQQRECHREDCNT